MKENDMIIQHVNDLFLALTSKKYNHACMNLPQRNKL